MSVADEIKLCRERLAYWRRKYDWRKASFDRWNGKVLNSERAHHPVARRYAEWRRSIWAKAMGEAATEVNKYVRRLHELVPPEGRVETMEHSLARRFPDTHDPVRKIVAKILVANPSMYVTATTGGHHAPNSYHWLGRAYDLGADSQAPKDACGRWCNEHLVPSLTEGIHNPTLSVKFGQRVSPSYWGSVTWAGHADHVHVAV